MLPFVHVGLTNRYYGFLVVAAFLSTLHYFWLINGEEFKQPLDPLYILLDTFLLNGLIYGFLVAFTLLF